MRYKSLTKRCLQLLVVIIFFRCSSFEEPYSDNYTGDQFETFIHNVEQLVVNTTDRALLVTKEVYFRLNETMPPKLRAAIQNLIANYIEEVDLVLEENASYAKKRKLCQQFRANNRYIERLRKKLVPDFPEFQVQLMSEAFYNNGRNTTQFDLLYLEFIRNFEYESKKLWQNMSEETVEQHEDLLEILDEIDREHELKEKDKLFDEFIEMFLFKNKQENRELE